MTQDDETLTRLSYTICAPLLAGAAVGRFPVEGVSGMTFPKLSSEIFMAAVTPIPLTAHFDRVTLDRAPGYVSRDYVVDVCATDSRRVEGKVRNGHDTVYRQIIMLEPPDGNRLRYRRRPYRSQLP